MSTWILIITVMVNDAHLNLNPVYYPSQEKCEEMKTTFLKMEVFQYYKAEATCKATQRDQ